MNVKDDEKNQSIGPSPKISSAISSSSTAVEHIDTTCRDKSTFSWWPPWKMTAMNDDVKLVRSNATNGTTANTGTATTVVVNTSDSNSSSSNNNVNYYNYFLTNYLQPLTKYTTTVSEKYLSTLHSGHCCMITGIPLLLHAYYGYSNFEKSSEQLVQQILMKQQQQQERMMATQTMNAVTANVVVPPSLSTPHLLEEGIRRQIGVAVASRALRVATTGMLGIFTVSIGMIFYSTQTSSVAQVLQTIQQSSRKQYLIWDQYIRTIFQSKNATNSQLLPPPQQQKRYDEHHPEFKKIQTMTEEEELEYIYQTYIQEQSSFSEQDEKGESQ